MKFDVSQGRGQVSSGSDKIQHASVILRILGLKQG